MSPSPFGFDVGLLDFGLGLDNNRFLHSTCVQYKPEAAPAGAEQTKTEQTAPHVLWLALT